MKQSLQNQKIISMNTRSSTRFGQTFLFRCEHNLSRRSALIKLVAACDTLVVSQRTAKAGLFGGIPEKDYQTETSSLADLAREVSTMPKDADGKEQKVESLRAAINGWVAKYRREPKFGGRPSYNNMYSAVNALSGHFNTFGPTAPVPRKRLDRVLYELDQTSLFLGKGR